MAVTVDELIVRIKADMSQLNRELKKLEGNVSQSTSRMESSFKKIGVAFAAIGGAAAGVQFTKGIIQTGVAVDTLSLKMNTLFGSAEAGAKAFDTLDKFASRVPFSLGEISAGAGPLAVVAGEAENMNELLQITGNIAALTGRPFNEMAGQIQRAFSGGITAAELLKDDGIKAMLGFEEGVSYSVAETIKRLQEGFGTGGEFDGIMEKLAKTAQGAMSMVGDAFFQMQKQMFQAGIADAVIVLSGAFRNLIISITPIMNQLAQLMGLVAKGLAPAINFLADNVEFLAIFLGVLAAKMVLVKAASLAAAAAMAIYTAANTALAVHTATAVSALTLMQKGIVITIASVKGLGVALVALSRILMRFLPFAILAGIAWLVSKFLELKRRAGSFGEAMKVLKDVFISAWDVMKAGIGVFGAVFTSIFKGVKADFLEFLADIQKRMSDFLLKLSNVIRKIPNMSGTAADLIGAGTEALEAHNELDRAASNLRRGAGEDIKKAMDEGKLATTKLTNAWRYLKSLLKDTEGEEAQAVNLGKVKIAVEDLTQTIKEEVDPAVAIFSNGMNSIADSISNYLVNAVADGKANLKDLRDSFNQTLKQMVADAIAAKIIRPFIGDIFTTAGRNTGGKFGDFITSIGEQGRRATGGPVNRNQPYVVGERGPELFVPQAAGSVINAASTRSMGGGGVVVNQTFNVSTGVQQTVRNEIRSLMPQIADGAKAAVADAKRRGGSYGRAFA